MAGTETVFGRDNSRVSKQVSSPPIKTPHVELAMLARRVDIGPTIKEYYNGSGFWAAMKAKYKVNYASIISSHNELWNDPVATSNLSDGDRSSLRKINADGGNVDMGQTILFKHSARATGYTVAMIPEFEPLLNSDIHVVVAGRNLEGLTLIVRIMQGDGGTLATSDAPIKVEHRGSAATELRIKVGAFHQYLVGLDTIGEIKNKDEFKNVAVAKIKLKDFRQAQGLLPSDQDKIIATGKGYAKLYIQVDAHTEHPKKIKESMVRSYGGESRKLSDWWKGDKAAPHGEGWIRLRAGWYDPVERPQRLMHDVNGDENFANGAFGMVRVKGTKPHQGVDIFATVGTPLYACVDGTVVHIVNNAPRHHVRDSYGNQVIIRLRCKDDLHQARNTKYDLPYADDNEVEHGPGFGDGEERYVMYGHMDTVSVAEGKPVWSGQQIGTSGKTGNAWNGNTRNRHLHFEIRDKHPLNFKRSKEGGLYQRTNPAFFIGWASTDEEAQKNNKDSSAA